MFLRGIFSKSSLNIMSTHTLEGLASLGQLDVIPKVVLEYLYETAAILGTKDYVAGVGNYVNTALLLQQQQNSKLLREKISHKEYNFVDVDDDEDFRLPIATLPDVVLDSNLDLVNKPTVSWSAKLRSRTDESISFKYELEDMIEQFNLARSYLLETYAMDLRVVLGFVMRGQEATKVYLKNVLAREQDMNLLEVLVYLIKFVEFEEYLKDGEGVLTLEW